MPLLSQTGKISQSEIWERSWLIFIAYLISEWGHVIGDQAGGLLSCDY